MTSSNERASGPAASAHRATASLAEAKRRREGPPLPAGRGLLAGVAIVALVGTVVLLQVVRDRRFPAVASTQQFLYVTSPAVISRMSLGYEALMADVYWMRAIQYFGGTRLSEGGEKNYELLYPLLELTTSLDPKFTMAYRFGAFFLSEPQPGGAGRSDLAVRLLEKAIAANPDRWEYPYDIGFIYYRDGDYRTAARWFQRAADVPKAADWLGPLAAVTLAAGGDTRASRLLWRNLLDSEADWLRQTATYRLQQLDAMDQIAQLEQLTAEHARRFGGPPRSWDDMIRAGMLNGIPVDPAGHPYALNPGGEVTAAEESPMSPLPTDQPK